MRQRRSIAAIALLILATSAQAKHFEYTLNLTGSYSIGGTEGCTQADPSGCPHDGTLTGLLSFDTPTDGDGAWDVTSNFGDITNFYVSLGAMPTDFLLGSVNVNQGAPNGSVQAADQTESFTFDWASRVAEYSYDYGYHAPNGAFTGTLAAIPEPGIALMLVAGLAAIVGARRRRTR